ncbi:MAG: hypothetical protein RR373_08095, partial [Akkermansia sp.]
RLFSNYPAVSPPLGVRWEPDATLRFAPLTQHVLPQTPTRRIRFPPEPFSPTSYFSNKLTAELPCNEPASWA